jgi:hypothetical protein
MKETTKEFTGRKAEYSLKEGGQHHNFIGVGCWDVFSFCHPPLEHNAVGKKMAFNEFEKLTVIHGRRFEHLRVRGSRVKEGDILGKKWSAQEKEEEGGEMNEI